MPLWGITTASETRPKWLKAGVPGRDTYRCYAANNGWVYDHPYGVQEVLVQVSGLATTFANANITAIFFANTTLAQGGTGTVTVVYNEQVQVTGSPTIRVNGSTTNATATYSSGTGTNRLAFTFTVPAQTQTLSLQGQSVTLAGGTINDTSGNVASSLAFTNTEVQVVTGSSLASANIAVD